MHGAAHANYRIANRNPNRCVVCTLPTLYNKQYYWQSKYFLEFFFTLPFYGLQLVCLYVFIRQPDASSCLITFVFKEKLYNPFLWTCRRRCFWNDKVTLIFPIGEWHLDLLFSSLWTLCQETLTFVYVLVLGGLQECSWILHGGSAVWRWAWDKGELAKNWSGSFVAGTSEWKKARGCRVTESKTWFEVLLLLALALPTWLLSCEILMYVSCATCAPNCWRTKLISYSIALWIRNGTICIYVVAIPSSFGNHWYLFPSALSKVYLWSCSLASLPVLEWKGQSWVVNKFSRLCPMFTITTPTPYSKVLLDHSRGWNKSS